jgi:hypothetical protein
MFPRWRGHTGNLEALYAALPGLGMRTIQSSTFIYLVASVENEEMAIAGTSWVLAQNFGVLAGASESTAIINGV